MVQQCSRAEGVGAVQFGGREVHVEGGDPRRQPGGVPGARADVRRVVPHLGGGALARLHLRDREGEGGEGGRGRHAGQLQQRRGTMSGGCEGAGEGGREGRGDQSALTASSGQRGHRQLGEEDQPHRHGRRGLATVWSRSGDRCAVHGK